MNVSRMIVGLLRKKKGEDKLSETDIVCLLLKKRVITSQPTINRLKNGYDGKIDHGLVVALTAIHKARIVDKRGKK